MTKVYDTAIVGAGFAGLSAARELKKAGKSVLVLEARDRVGGRTLSHTLPNGITIDLGGQWVGPTQTRFQALIKTYGAKQIPTPSEGDDMITYQGQLTCEVPLAAQALYDKIDLLCSEIDVKAPWKHPKAEEWDRQTFASWLKQNASEQAAAELVGRGVAGGLLAGDAGDFSLLQTLFYVASGGGVQSLMGCEGGAQDARIVGGSQTIAKAMAAELGEAALKLREPVRVISHDNQQVTVITDKNTYTARRVIVAIPPTLAGRIDYQPGLPASRDGLMQRMPAGYALKLLAFYKTPFWRKQGWSGNALTDSGIVSETFDNSPPDGSYYAMVMFAYGKEARWLRAQPAAMQKKLALKHLAELYGSQALDPADFLMHDWTNEVWTRGCFSGHLTPGSWTTYGPALRKPCGLIHWAGTETAIHWNGYIDGAIESGQRAANEILKTTK